MSDQILTSRENIRRTKCDLKKIKTFELEGKLTEQMQSLSWIVKSSPEREKKSFEKKLKKKNCESKFNFPDKLKRHFAVYIS